PSPAVPRAITSEADGRQLIGDLAAIMDALLAIIEEETAFVRAGRIDQAAALEPRKAELASRYLGSSERLKQNSQFLKASLPQQLAALRRQHETFRDLLKINLTVLATAHAVSEGIIRGVAGEISRKAAPQTYGVSGRPTAAPATAMRPVSISRTL